MTLVAGDGWVDHSGPVVDAAGERLNVFEALLTQPHRDIERTGAVVADDDDGGVGVELLVGATGDVAHRHEGGAGKGRGGGFPRFADVEDEGLSGLLEFGGEAVDGDLGRKRHRDSIPATRPATLPMADPCGQARE